MNTDEPTQNPIVAMATKLRARRDLDAAIDSSTPVGKPPLSGGAEASFAALAESLAIGCKRLNSILGRSGVTYVRLEKPLRVRLRFAGRRLALDLDEARQLIVIRGLELDGEYQFDTSLDVPALINLSLLSTSEGYGVPLTAPVFLKLIAADAQLARPAHLDAPGPLRF